MKRFNLHLIALLSLIIGITSVAQAGPIGGTPQSVSITATQSESMTVTLAGGNITLPLTGVASNAVTATVAYNVTVANHTVGLWQATWLGSAGSALASGANSIPSSSIQLDWTPQGGFATTNVCTVTIDAKFPSAVAGAACEEFNPITQSALSTAGGHGNFTDTYALQTIGNTSTFAPGTYTGTFFVSYVIP